MYKAIAIITIALLFAGCGGGGKADDSGNAKADTTDMPRSLVIYFSHTGENYSVGSIREGNTKHIADFITQLTGAEQWEVEPEESYDLPYLELEEKAYREQTEGLLPVVKGNLPDLTRYRTIYIGSPVWWGTYPRVMVTVLKRCDLRGKTVVPFVTHEGSEFGQCIDDLKALHPEANYKEPLAIYGHDAPESREDVERWLRVIGELD